jgi:anti-sigma factor RsiW
MNPDKWFDYLEGKLPDWERTRLEEDLATDPQLQREFAAARRIHSNMQGESREVLLEDDPATAQRGRKMALRVGTAFIILMGLNVAAGLWIIARKEAANPNHKLLAAQMQQQLKESAQRAAAALTPPPLGLSDITVPVAPGQLNSVADQIVATAQRLGGSATRELPDPHSVGVLVDLPKAREPEFRAALAVMTGGAPAAPSPNGNAGDSAAQESFVVHIVEPASP